MANFVERLLEISSAPSSSLLVDLKSTKKFQVYEVKNLLEKENAPFREIIQSNFLHNVLEYKYVEVDKFAYNNLVSEVKQLKASSSSSELYHKQFFGMPLKFETKQDEIGFCILSEALRFGSGFEKEILKKTKHSSISDMIGVCVFFFLTKKKERKIDN